LRSAGAVRGSAAEREQSAANDGLRDNEHRGDLRFSNANSFSHASRQQARVAAKTVRHRAVQPQPVHSAARLSGCRA